jgi:hypothetical protein
MLKVLVSALRGLKLAPLPKIKAKEGRRRRRRAEQLEEQLISGLQVTCETSLRSKAYP